MDHLLSINKKNSFNLTGHLNSSEKQSQER